MEGGREGGREKGAGGEKEREGRREEKKEGDGGDNNARWPFLSPSFLLCFPVSALQRATENDAL